MIINKLSLINFKSYESLDIDFSSKINCFVGNNGIGKTNILDAIYYLSFCKSFFNPIDSQNIRFDQEFMLIQGDYEHESENHHVHCGLKRNQKKVFKWNKADYGKLAEHIGKIPLVIITPDDSELITEGSDKRRKFMDGVIAQYDPVYLDKLLQYNKALQQRNALLKVFFKERRYDQASMEIWNVKLAELGEYLFNDRKKFIADLIPYFQEYYERISGGNEQVGINYLSHLEGNNLLDLFESSRREDEMRTFTTKGIHKDDLEFTINGYPIKKFGSQGQQKSFLISLKLAQLDFMSKKKGFAPLLLLDDIFDKLDDQRVKQMIELVGEDRFGQIFITDTSEQRIKSAVENVQGEVKIIDLTQIKNG